MFNERATEFQIQESIREYMQEQIGKGVLHCDHCGKAFDLARGEGYVLDGACLCVACWG